MDLLSKKGREFVRKYGLAVFLGVLAIVLFLVFSGQLTGE